MKINEILSESLHNIDYFKSGEVSDDVKGSLRGLVAFKQLRTTDTYLQYRMGIAFAAAGNDDAIDAESAFAENMVAVAYTDAEMEIIKKTAARLGVDVTVLTKSDRVEQSDVNKKSPVPTRK